MGDDAAKDQTADRELIISCVLDAPRKLVWKAWTDPTHLAQWWGPNGFTTTIEKMDLKPGGDWQMVMHAPDGNDYPNSCVFLEVIEPERIVYAVGGGKTGEAQAHFEAAWTFADKGGSKTRLTNRSVFATAEQRDAVAERYRAVDGGNQTMGRLAAYLRTLV